MGIVRFIYQQLVFAEAIRNRQAIKADIEKIYADPFLSISSYKDITIEAYNKVESQIQKSGEKYVGKVNRLR